MKSQVEVISIFIVTSFKTHQQIQVLWMDCLRTTYHYHYGWRPEQRAWKLKTDLGTRTENRGKEVNLVCERHSLLWLTHKNSPQRSNECPPQVLPAHSKFPLLPQNVFYSEHLAEKTLCFKNWYLTFAVPSESPGSVSCFNSVGRSRSRDTPPSNLWPPSPVLSSPHFWSRFRHPRAPRPANTSFFYLTSLLLSTMSSQIHPN